MGNSRQFPFKHYACHPFRLAQLPHAHCDQHGNGDDETLHAVLLNAGIDTDPTAGWQAVQCSGGVL